MLKLTLYILLMIHCYFRLTMDYGEQENVDGLIAEIKTHPKDTKIGIFASGKIPYYCSEYTFFDFLGKSDKRIAKSEKKTGIAGHNKYLYDYSIGELKPDLIITAADFNRYDEK